MIMALSAKNKIGFIDTSVSRPPEDSPEFPLWTHCNHMVRSWLLNSINDDLASHIIYAKITSEVWPNLKEQFSQSTAPRIFQIRRLVSNHMQGQAFIVVYFNKLKAYWDELFSYPPIPYFCGAR